ncbi:MAG TPA: glycosyltransferase family 39 protein [bacterium]|nr:glycosyltransferase family 39 protein [bacterium]
MTDAPKRSDRTWVVACIVLAAALRFFRIGHQSLWIDELISLGLATEASGAEFWRALLRDVHGPVTTAMLHGWVQVGTGEAWLRTLYALPSVATVPLIYRLGSDLFDRRAGRWAALAAAVSPFLVWYGQEVRNYSWLLLWATAALVLFLRLWDGVARRRDVVLAGIVFILGLLTNFSFVFLLAALTALVVLRRPFSPALFRTWALLGACVLAVFAPWFLDWFQRMGAERIFVGGETPLGVPLREASGFSPAALGYLLWVFGFGYSLGPPLESLHLDRSIDAIASHAAVLVPGVAVLAVGGVLGLRRAARDGRLPVVLAILGVPLALAILLAAREVKTFHPRYLMTSFPIFLALVTAGWAAGTTGRTAGLIALALVAMSLRNHYFDPAYGKEDSRAAAQLVLDREEPGDAVVVIYSFRPFRHYYSDAGPGTARLHHLHKSRLQTDEQMRAHVDQAREGSRRVWLILSRWWDVAPEQRIRDAFADGLREVSRWSVPGVKVTLYEVVPE